MSEQKPKSRFFREETSPGAKAESVVATVRGKSFSLEYGSDLYWLWGWGYRLDLYLQNESPNDFSWMIFLPDRLARDAMMKFSVNYRFVMDQISEYLAFTENNGKLFCKTTERRPRKAFATQCLTSRGESRRPWRRLPRQKRKNPPGVSSKVNPRQHAIAHLCVPSVNRR